MKRILGVCIAVAVVMVGFCEASIPNTENFDALVTGSDFDPPQGSWGADVATIVVTDSVKQGGSGKSVNVNGGTITNRVEEGAASGVVWTDFYLIPQLGAAPTEAATNEANHVHYYDTNGFLNVFTASGWQMITEDIHGNAVAAVDTNDFNRITIYQNFTDSISAVLVDGVVVLQDAAFVGSSANYDAFEVQNQETAPAYLDTYSVGSTLPAGLPSDATELHDNGYVARNFNVGAGGDYASLAAVDGILRDGDTITIVGALTPAGTATFAADVSILGADASTTADIVVGAGSTLTISGMDLDVGSATINGTLVVGNGDTFDADDVVFGAAGAVDSNGGTWGIDSPFVELTGTFDITGSDWNDPNAESDVTLPFADDFEQYALTVDLDDLGFRGWGADSADSEIISLTGQQGSRSASVSGLVSNRVDGGGETKVWTDLQIYALQGVEPDSPDTSSSSVLFYFTTNGFLSVYDTNVSAFVELSTDANGGAVSAVQTSTWTRVSVFTHFGDDNAALFLNDQLLSEQIGFPSGGALDYSMLAVENSESATVAIDDVEITTLVPGDLTGDVDSDGRDDADEIHEYGSIDVLGPLWTTFRFL